MKIEPVTLEGRAVRLLPLALHHHAELCEVGLDPEIWRYTTGRAASADDIRRYIETALEWQAAGTALPFATVAVATGRAVGSTRFANIDRANRRVEIGWTWLGRDWQRTALNTEAKYLMLRHAFERWGCIRVELKTDALNTVSRAAILRLGATEEGTFRKHMVMPHRVRDTVWYSILDDEWPRVRERLESRMRDR